MKPIHGVEDQGDLIIDERVQAQVQGASGPQHATTTSYRKLIVPTGTWTPNYVPSTPYDNGHHHQEYHVPAQQNQHPPHHHHHGGLPNPCEDPYHNYDVYQQYRLEYGDIPIPPEWHIKHSPFTPEQVDTMCDVLIKGTKENKYELLEKCINNLPKGMGESENVLRAKAAIALHKKDYLGVYEILVRKDGFVFSTKYHKELQQVYQSARYNEAQKQRPKVIGAVEKYRIRKKYSLPKAIWDGEAMSYNFKEKDRRILIEAFLQNGYPNAETKKRLQEVTGLDKKQIDNWFKNRRQRSRVKNEGEVLVPKKPRKSKKSSSDNSHPSMGLTSPPMSSIGSGGSGSGGYPMGYPEGVDVKYNVAAYESHPVSTAQAPPHPHPHPHPSSHHHYPPQLKFVPLPLQTLHGNGRGKKKGGAPGIDWITTAALVEEKVKRKRGRGVGGASGGTVLVAGDRDKDAHAQAQYADELYQYSNWSHHPNWTSEGYPISLPSIAAFNQHHHISEARVQVQ